MAGIPEWRTPILVARTVAQEVQWTVVSWRTDPPIAKLAH
jgi:hypothetical protein